MVGVYAVRRRQWRPGGGRSASAPRWGASRREVIALVLRTGLAPVVAGPAVAVVAGDALGGMLFGVKPGDPFSLAALRVD